LTEVGGDEVALERHQMITSLASNTHLALH
jgi:hypothetical protein